MTIRVNLLPHRERKRKERREQFYVLMGMVAVLAAVVSLGLIVMRNADIETQRGINALIKDENDKLDVQIAEITKLKEEIEALRARQKAVEDLQVDRNQPVRVFDNLVRYMPEGTYLKAIKQDGKRITMVGLAQSQERVSEVLRNVGNQATWLDSPDLIEIKSVPLSQNNKDSRRVFEFSMTAGLKDAPPVDPSKPPAPVASEGTAPPVAAPTPAPSLPAVPAPKS
jgi:type IV pilus assembly protein PilN